MERVIIPLYYNKNYLNRNNSAFIFSQELSDNVRSFLSIKGPLQVRDFRRFKGESIARIEEIAGERLLYETVKAIILTRRNLEGADRVALGFEPNFQEREGELTYTFSLYLVNRKVRGTTIRSEK